ncbi:membrane protein insertase YidC [uncultured Aquimonas sp.]|uniref:membrane protein insertase YidC n=1 Tax=uncultured Aquimonas sp. TaxID=385483 RepID=UPI00086D9909|nr:membrane protein insertase YidC [uncultured Aquimonas sp.]ODU42002.1 MAG: membrane protein insertase YidC [Xanthomonadaceae bacterium SCN 69-123]
MNQARTFLLIAWLMVGYLAWDTWQQDYSRPRAEPAPQAELSTPPSTGDLPEFQPERSSTSPSGSAPTPAVASSGRRLGVRTDVLDLQIDTQGGSVVQADLLAYAQEPKPGSPPVRLMSTQGQRYFIGQSGYVGNRAELPNHLSAFTAEGDSFELGSQDRLEVPLRWTSADGLSLVRTFVFERGSYVVTVSDRFENQTGQPVELSAYRQLVRVTPPALPGSSFTNPAAYSFVGAAWYSPQSKFEKRAFGDFSDGPTEAKASTGWIAMLEHYFFAAWIPEADEAQTFSTATEDGGRHRIRTLGPAFDVAPGAQVESSARFYAGPKLQDQLEGIAPGLKLTMDYGIFTMLAQPMAWLLGVLHDITGNWGWAIVLLVVILKLALFKLSEAQYKSFAKMRAVQPRIEALKERYGEDRQKFQTAMMELYKKEKINPMGGCLPILIQIPIFISLYWVLIEAVELRHAPWILWINNLTAPDPYFILPVLNLLTMWATQKLSPTPGMDPMQKRIMQIMPIAFGVMFAFFPAGLVLYWTTNGALGLLQQWIILRRHGGTTAPKAA